MVACVSDCKPKACSLYNIKDIVGKLIIGSAAHQANNNKECTSVVEHNILSHLQSNSLMEIT